MSFTAISRRAVFVCRLEEGWRVGRKPDQIAHGTSWTCQHPTPACTNAGPFGIAWNQHRQFSNNMPAIPAQTVPHCSATCWQTRGGGGHTGTWTQQTSAGRKEGQQGYIGWGSPTAPGSWQSSMVTVLTCAAQAATLLFLHISTKATPEASEDQLASQLNTHCGNHVHRALGPLESHGKSRGNIMRIKKDKRV